MNVTCLGTGDAVGVPAPLCDCEYCAESDRRRRPGLLVESGDTTVLLDVPPDVTEGLHATETTSLDGVFATHAHYDHFHGVHELNHTQYERHVWNEGEYDHPHPLSDGLTVYGTDSETATATLAYAPDANRLDPTELPSLDLLFVDGSVLGPELHADAEELREQVARVDADRVVPTTSLSRLVTDREERLGESPADASEHVQQVRGEEQPQNAHTGRADRFGEGVDGDELRRDVRDGRVVVDERGRQQREQHRPGGHGRGEGDDTEHEPDEDERDARPRRRLGEEPPECVEVPLVGASELPAEGRRNRHLTIQQDRGELRLDARDGGRG